MAEIVLHHYDRSPYSEKVRLAFGLKAVAWASVRIPTHMPKPDLMPLTGGYRRTPVMQIGADIYCDSQLILRELDRRFPTPPLQPVDGLGEIIAGCAEKTMFWPAAGLVFSHIGDGLPEAFKRDREKFSGRNFDPQAMRAMQPYWLDQVRATLDRLDRMLAGGRSYLLGEAPGTADLAAYHCVWFLRHGIAPDAKPLGEFKRIAAWADRMAAIGHGSRREIDAREALAIAARVEPVSAISVDAADPAGRKPGQRFRVTPDDTGRDPVVGELVGSDAQSIILRRNDPQVGTVHVHFPRAGFVVDPV